MPHYSHSIMLTSISIQELHCWIKSQLKSCRSNTSIDHASTIKAINTGINIHLCVHIYVNGACMTRKLAKASREFEHMHSVRIGLLVTVFFVASCFPLSLTCVYTNYRYLMASTRHAIACEHIPLSPPLYTTCWCIGTAEQDKWNVWNWLRLRQCILLPCFSLTVIVHVCLQVQKQLQHKSTPGHKPALKQHNCWSTMWTRTCTCICNVVTIHVPWFS